MSSVNELIVREYFESLGYLVSQPCKYTVPGRRKRSEEEIEMVVHNPTVTQHQLPSRTVLWSSADLGGIKRAVVCVRGWHTERFYASTLKQARDILAFVKPGSLKHAAGLLGSTSFAKILCLPRLPASDSLRESAIKAISTGGVDGIISFETILQELILRSDAKKNYEKSDVLQLLRILKAYNLLKDPQLELFEKRKRKRKTSGK